MIEYVKMGLLRNALIKFVHDARFANRFRGVQSASLLINILFSAAAGGLLFVSGGWLADLLKTPQLSGLLHQGIFLVILQIPFNHCEIVQQSKMKFETTFYAYFLRQGSLFIFILGTAVINKSLLSVQSLVTAQIVSMLVASVYFLFATRKLLYTGLHYDKEIIVRLLQYGKFVFGTALVSHLYKFSDHFVTAYATGNPAKGKVFVSYYSVTGRISGVLDVPFMAVADVLFAKNAQAMTTDGAGKVKYYFEKMVGTLTALIIPASLFILFVPGLVIRIVAGDDYLAAVPVLQLTMFFAFLRPFFSQFGFTMDSIGKPHVNFWANVVFLILSLVSTYLCIRWFGGLMGAVYATTFNTIAGCIAFYFLLRKSLNIELKNIVTYTFSTYRDLFHLLVKRKTRHA